MKCEWDKLLIFLQKWTTEYKDYNALTSNCQTFAKDLYEFAVGKHYKFQIGPIVNKMQSFVDFDREWKKLEEEFHQNMSKESNEQNGDATATDSTSKKNG